MGTAAEVDLQWNCSVPSSLLQLVFAFGAFVDKYWLMVAGRFVFG